MAKAPHLNNVMNLLTNCVASTGHPKRVYYEEYIRDVTCIVFTTPCV